MSFVKIMVHCVWGTKNRAPMLVKEERYKLIEYIGMAAAEKNRFIGCSSGKTDHLHAQKVFNNPRL
jgi:putative transposase